MKILAHSCPIIRYSIELFGTLPNYCHPLPLMLLESIGFTEKKGRKIKEIQLNYSQKRRE